MLAADHVQGFVDGEYVGASLEWGEATIPNGEISPQNLRDRQTATDPRRRASARSAVEIRSGYAELGSFATSGTLRSDVVENAVVAAAHLIHGGGRERVCLREGDVTPVIDKSLIAGKEKRLRKIARAPATRDVGNRLIVAKTGESIVGTREIVVQPHVKLRFIQLAHRLIYKKADVTRAIDVRMGIEGNQLRGDRIDQVRRNLVAGRAAHYGCLAAIRVC